eukprot:TRINITY_DN8957_c0_g1_i1.p1 TRINITY_DN8957_c0_g1~~TRINITY_DN8957_c0_g1_i1.p1  ORF type:complete len:128 (+),score=16.21 TRINITY_DN8957_c0_g1_i1:100-483(+)
MASWQDYVDKNMVGTGACSQAGIYGLDGSLWAKSSTFAPTNAEIKALVSCFSSNQTLFSSGLKFGNKKYFGVVGNDASIYVKNGQEGYCCVKTKRAVLIGKFDSGIVPGKCSVVVEKLGSFLIGQQY